MRRSGKRSHTPPARRKVIEFIMSKGLAMAWVKKMLSMATVPVSSGSGFAELRSRLMRRPTHAPGRSAARKGCSPTGIPVSDAAVHRGS